MQGLYCYHMNHLPHDNCNARLVKLFNQLLLLVHLMMVVLLLLLLLLLVETTCSKQL